MRIPVPVQTYSMANASTTRLLNCYAETLPKDARGNVLVRTAPGITAFATCGSGPGRGTCVMGGNLYVLSGTTLYKVTTAGVVSTIGTVPGSSPAYMSANTYQLAIVADGVGYVCNGSTVTAITDVDFTARSPGPCVFCDNYILFVDVNTGIFFGSALADATTYDGLACATAEASPDNLVSINVDHRQVVLFGETTSELWYNAGGTGFPFDRSPGGIIELGIAGPRAHVKHDNTVFWLANDLTVRRMNGVTPVRVSTHGMERALLSYSVTSDCQAYSYSIGGHLCVAMRFPTEGKTWVHDVTTSEWHERENWDQTAFLGMAGTLFGGFSVIQNPNTGAIGILDNTAVTEWGNSMRVQWTYQPIYKDGLRLYHTYFEIGMEQGVGTVTGAGSNPLITLEYSNDGGRTWRTLPTKTIGAIGRYRTIVNWNGLGCSRDRVYRATLSDPVPMTMWGTIVDVTVGKS